MDLQTFIQSGLLETYVLGQTNAEERSLVERMLSQHAEARTELSAIEQAIEQYALAQASPPPAWMKGRILDQLEQMPTAGPVAAPAGSTGTLRLFQMLAAALLVAVAFLWYKNNATQTQQAEQQTQLAAVQNKLSDCTLHAQTTQEMVNVIRDSDTRIFRLTNGADGGKGGAIMYKNDVREVTALDISGVMAPSAPDKYLQLWAVINDKPVSLGMVKMQAPNGWQEVSFHKDVQFFAISEENDPQGSPTPTVVVMHS
ncbi:MAG: anti-sigma factor [Saprospiraceae bacterium]